MYYTISMHFAGPTTNKYSALRRPKIVGGRMLPCIIILSSGGAGLLLLGTRGPHHRNPGTQQPREG
eukprot:COSAG01_NODE_5606_length_4150_cov_3.488028_3_plen_66_part_00